MNKAIAFLLALTLALTLCLSCAAAEDTAFLGAPYEDFTVTDTEGNTFTLSEARKNHEAVLINFWASWCGPCQMECPHLEAAWKKYGDRVAFIALSAEEKDTIETAAGFREEYGLTFPVGIDEGLALFSRSGQQGYPQTVIVDRFGNVGFLQVGSFSSAAELERLLDWFLDENYTQTAVLEEIPPAASTAAFPLSEKRAMSLENEGVRKISIGISDMDHPETCYVIPDGNARIRIDISANDNPFRIWYQDYWTGYLPVTDLYSPEQNAFVHEQVLEGTYSGEAYHFSYGHLFNEELLDEDPDAQSFFLLRDDQYIDEVIELLTRSGYTVTGWEYAEDSTADENAQAEDNAPKAYILHAADQYGSPVPDVAVNFCTDTACVPAESDENGLIVFSGPPDVYHVQLVDVPEGYSYDEQFELYTTREYGEWVLRVKKGE